MAVRPLIRPRPRLSAPAPMASATPAELENLPRVLARVSDSAGQTVQATTRPLPRQPIALKPQTVAPTKAETSTTSLSSAQETVTEKPLATKPTLPAFWQSRKVVIAAGIFALVSAVAIGYQFRPKQQIIVVHPAKQPEAVVATPASSINPASAKPAFQPLSPSPALTASKETTSTASLMPRATWPADKTPATPLKTPTPAIQTATKPLDTRTSLNSTPNSPMSQENMPRMSPQFPQAPNPTTNVSSSAAVVYNPTMNAAASPLASGYAPQNNQPPQNGSPQFATQQNGGPQYTASRPNYQPNTPPAQPQPPQDGSFGAYGGARLEGQINPLPLRR